MSEPEIICESHGAVRVLRLNRPEAMNALTYGMVKGLRELCLDAGEDDSVRAVVLTGEGRGFCTGADLSGPGGRSDINTPVGMKLTTGLYGGMVEALAGLEKPVVGAVNGIAAGAGCNLALSCDLLIASADARFIQIFVRRGLVADAGGTY
ncbi:MAG: enoyl-CoA hydratase/isomerase family protein, partial [Candidatus Geothermincolia bacterium]